MNVNERIPGLGNEATLDYGDGDYRVVRPGSFVRCAVTGTPIRLEDLRYWSAEWQEPYSSPEAVRIRLQRSGKR